MVVGHPFDLVKVRLQTSEKGTYTSAVDVVRKSIARAGLARVGLEMKERCRWNQGEKGKKEFNISH